MGVLGVFEVGRALGARALAFAFLALLASPALARAAAPIVYGAAPAARPAVAAPSRLAAYTPARAAAPSLKPLVPSYGYGAGAEVASGPVIDLRGALPPEPGQHAPKPSPAPAQPAAEVTPVAAEGQEVGRASWYGDEFQGRRTASGEPFDAEALTAAHPSMPLPSMARVVNLENGKEVTVRVNDRGPFHGDRIIDVSRKAAEILDFKSAGHARVQVTYLGPASPPVGVAEAPAPGQTPPPAAAREGGYYVQIGAFAATENAEAAGRGAAELGAVSVAPATGAGGRALYRVRLGPWPDHAAAEAVRSAAIERGYRDARIARD